MAEKDEAEELLEAHYNALIDQLKKATPGTRESLTLAAALVLVKKDLEAYKKNKKK